MLTASVSIPVHIVDNRPIALMRELVTNVEEQNRELERLRNLLLLSDREGVGYRNKQNLLIADNTTLQQETITLNEELQQLRAQNNTLLCDNAVLTREIKRLRQQGPQIDTVYERDGSFDYKLSVLIKEQQTDREEISKLKEENKKLLDKLQKVEVSAQDVIRGRNAQIYRLRDEIARLESALEASTVDSQGSAAMCKKIKSETQRLHDEFEHAVLSRDSLQLQVKSLTQLCSTQAATVTDVEARNKVLEAEWRVAQCELQRCKVHLLSLQGEHSIAERDNRARIDQLNREKAQGAHFQQAAVHRTDNLRFQLESLNKQLAETQRQRTQTELLFREKKVSDNSCDTCSFAYGVFGSHHDHLHSKYPHECACFGLDPAAVHVHSCTNEKSSNERNTA